MNGVRISWWERLTGWLGALSFRTGCAVLGVCVLCYGVSFGQMLLPLPVGVKSLLWVLFFGLAKCAQYAALLILGKEGIRRVRMTLRLGN